MPVERNQDRAKPRVKTYTSTGSEKVKDPRDEILKKFSKNFRRVMENRENLLAEKPKSVKFDPETVETSINGTQSLGKINQLSDTSSSSFSSASTATGDNSTLSASDNSSSDSCTFNGSLSHSYIDTSSITASNNNSSVGASTTSQSKSVAQIKVVQRQRRSSTNKGFVTPSKPSRRLTSDLPPASTPECFNPVSFETPKPKASRRSSIMTDSRDEDSSSVTVAVRVRPFTTREIATGEAKCVVSMVDNETIVTEKSGNTHHFNYDYSFWSFDKHGGSYSNQEHVYNTLAQPMLGKAFEGYNVCLFAYGQTGSGKSYSIMGQGADTGVIPRFCEDLFSRVEAETSDRVNIQISFFEIYNEKIHDLLQHDNKDKMGKKVNLKVREHPLLGPFVEGLSSHSVETFEGVKTWLNLGNKHRATAATGMNDKSSRSHSVFTMVLTQTKVDTIEQEKHEHSITSKINLVDLAGSERQSQAKTSGDRLREGVSINKSLLTLGKVISLLSEQSSLSGKRKIFIPYRDSVLTWLLKESLGGNSKTAMLATIGPSNFHVDETLSTLRYAKQARSIINQAKVNEDPKAKLIRELRSEIDKLKSQSGVMGADPEIIVSSLAEISSLRDQLMEKEREMQEMTKSWQERLKKSDERKVQEAKSLEKSGISFRVDNKRPSLVNLNEDPQLSEMLLYILKDGQTKIGQNREGSTHDVKLCGPLIADNHCILNYVNDVVSITPVKDALTYVNGNQITDPTVLHHGDRVILGGDHYFRFCNPKEASKPGRKSIGKGLKDFEFARKELLDVQNAKLQAELDEAKKKHQEELSTLVAKTKQAANLELSMQRHEFEDKLSELEKALNEQRQANHDTEQDKTRAENIIRELEEQKLMLEQEVQSNRKRQEQEAKAAEKMCSQAVLQSRAKHSKIVEQLQKEKQKIQQDVERLELMRLRRNSPSNTPRLTPIKISHGSELKDSKVKTDLYKTALLVREANKIAQYLKKELVFTREDVQEGEDPGQTVIKMTNTKLGISTFWAMDKFEDKLIHMREMYQHGEEAEPMNGEVDEVFCDPNDTWEKDDRVTSSPSISPFLQKGRMRTSMAGVVSKLSYDSDRGSKSREDVISESSELNGCSSTMSVCRDLISVALETFKGSVTQESLSDKVLTRCEVLKRAVHDVLDAYNNRDKNSSNKNSFVDSDLMQISSIQVAHSLDMLLNLCGLWSAQFEELGSGLVQDLCSKILSAVKKLGHNLVLFLQGCENDIETLVKETSSQIQDCMIALCRNCGELSLATATGLLTLGDAQRSSTDGQQDTRIKLGHDVRQAFLEGCDVFIDKTLQGSLKTVEECEIRLQGFSDLLDDSDYSTALGFALYHAIKGGSMVLVQKVEEVTACCKVFLSMSQQLQVDLDSTLRKSVSHTRSENFYQRGYGRSQGMVNQVTNLTDAVALLTQATEPLIHGPTDSILQKQARCAEMIKKSVNKLLSTTKSESGHHGNNSADSDSQSEMSDTSLLSDAQLESLDVASQDVKLAIRSLINAIKTALESTETESNSSQCSMTSSKRNLPETNGTNGAGDKHATKQKKMRRSLSLVDMNEVL